MTHQSRGHSIETRGFDGVGSIYYGINISQTIKTEKKRDKKAGESRLLGRRFSAFWQMG